jgi:hypothetical protein
MVAQDLENALTGHGPTEVDQDLAGASEGLIGLLAQARDALREGGEGPAETWELLPIANLQPGDVAYIMGERHIIDGEPWHPEEMRVEMLRVPMRTLDGLDRMAPPYERQMKVPVRVIPSRKRLPGRPYRPDQSRQDNDLIGMDVNTLLDRIRAHTGPGEPVPPDLVRRLDSWMSRGFVPPGEWAKGGTRRLLAWTTTAKRDLGGVQSTLTRLEQELIARDGGGQE